MNWNQKLEKIEQKLYLNISRQKNHKIPFFNRFLYFFLDIDEISENHDNIANLIDIYPF